MQGIARGEIERGFVGALMMRPSILDESDVSDEWFRGGIERRVFNAIKAIREAGYKPDLISVSDKMPGYKVELATMFDGVASSANWRYYNDRLREAWIDDELVGLGEKLADHDAPIETRLAEVESEVLKFALAGKQNPVASPSDVIPRMAHTIRDRYEHRGRSVGPVTGIEHLDMMINGLEPRQFYAIGGRPSAGKSALAQTIAVNVAVHQKIPIGLVSIESSTDEVYGRFYANLARIEGRRIRSGFLTPRDFEAIKTAEAAIGAAPLYVWDKPNASFREVRGIARYMVKRHGIKVLIVDYLQIIKWPGAKDRLETAANVSTGLKEIAREFNIAVVALAQLGRQADERKPSMGDFQWASQIEQDADVGLLLWHPESADPQAGKSFIIIAKAREGRTGTVPVVFERDFIRYCDVPEAGSERAGEEPRTPYRD